MNAPEAMTGSTAAGSTITALEAQLEQQKALKRYEECSLLQDQIEDLKQAQIDMAVLEDELKEAEGLEDFRTCADIQAELLKRMESVGANRQYGEYGQEQQDEEAVERSMGPNGQMYVINGR